MKECLFKNFKSTFFQISLGIMSYKYSSSSLVENQDLKCILQSQNKNKQKNLNIISPKFLTQNVSLIIHDHDEIFSFSFQIYLSR